MAGFFVVLVAAPTAAFGLHAPISTRNQHEPSWLNNGIRNACPRVATTSPLRGRLREGGLAAGGAEGKGDSGVFYTPADLDSYSAPWGITLHYTGTLNTYRIEAHRSNGEVAGYTTGFYVGDYLHLDKVQVGGCPLRLRCAGLREVLFLLQLTRNARLQCHTSHLHDTMMLRSTGEETETTRGQTEKFSSSARHHGQYSTPLFLHAFSVVKPSA